MLRARRGFTLVEMLFVVILGGLVVAVGTRQIGRTASRRAVENARDAFILTAQRARAEAMRTGRLVHLQVVPGSGEVRVAESSGTAVYTLAMSDLEVALVAPDLSLCYTSRGYALPGCTSINVETEVAFARGPDTATAAVLPLGQVRRSP